MNKVSTNDNQPDWYIEGKDNIWNPYSIQITPQEPLYIEEANGVYLRSTNGDLIIDGISSWWVACHGHNHPYIINQIKLQMDKLCHVMFANIAHEQAYKFAHRLIEIMPQGMKKVFYSESGSVAVEIAIKIAVQYWSNKSVKNKNRIIYLKNGYHGETMGAISVSDPEVMESKIFENNYVQQFMVRLPETKEDLEYFEQYIIKVKDQTAAMIVEPLMQGAGGFIFYEASILKSLYQICKKHHILFIADEIATNFLRLGSMFAVNQAEITPDIMTLGKALSGGHLPLAATVVTDEVYQAFYSDDYDKILFHSSTFMGNPLALAAANASLDLFQTAPRLEQVEHIEQTFIERFNEIAKIPIVKNIRVKGAVAVAEIDADFQQLLTLRKNFFDDQVLIRPIKNVVYLAPSFIIKDHEIDVLTNSITKNLKKL